ncbi:hypothetical protein [Chryseobacterium indologenes]|uniref:hypothetical protein n=1 Tax=Chryseobacterium indologenes TaxID=253 RepID=UPI003019FE2F
MKSFICGSETLSYSDSASAISNEELKFKIFEVAWKQQIVKDCSHLLIFCAWESYTSERVDGFFKYTSDYLTNR